MTDDTANQLSEHAQKVRTRQRERMEKALRQQERENPKAYRAKRQREAKHGEARKLIELRRAALPERKPGRILRARTEQLAAARRRRPSENSQQGAELEALRDELDQTRIQRAAEAEDTRKRQTETDDALANLRAELEAIKKQNRPAGERDPGGGGQG